MIVTIRHKGLDAYYRTGETKGLPQKLVKRLAVMLSVLDVMQGPEDLTPTLPGLRLHPLKGDLKGFWSATVSGNWRLVFRFEHQQVTDLELLDYH